MTPATWYVVEDNDGLHIYKNDMRVATMAGTGKRMRRRAHIMCAAVRMYSGAAKWVRYVNRMAPL